MRIRGLRVRLGGPAAPDVIHGFGLSLNRGGIHGLIGESGSGKTTAARAILGLLPEGSSAQGSIRLEGLELMQLPERLLRRVRGRRIGLIVQDAAAALNPHRSLEAHFQEVLAAHRGAAGRAERRLAAADCLRSAGLEVEALTAFPHQLSLGMCQRAVIALALAPRPVLLIADEPTASLDALRSWEVLDLLVSLARARGIGVLLISHELRPLLRVADRISVLDGGRIVESATPARLVADPRHGRTREMLSACWTADEDEFAGPGEIP